MYDVLNLYGEPYDPKRPFVNPDEKPQQLPSEKGMSIPLNGEVLKNTIMNMSGTANIFMAVEFKAEKRVTQVTKRRTMAAQFVKMFVDEYPDAEIIRLITDNLNTHNEKSFYETFDKDGAERILSRIEFHYTPKHASWLNAVEIEINVMDIECTGRWIGDKETLIRKVAAWSRRRNDQKKKINWKFTGERADKKLSIYYV